MIYFSHIMLIYFQCSISVTLKYGQNRKKKTKTKEEIEKLN